MNIPKFWANSPFETKTPDGDAISGTCWRSSETSQAEAEQAAQAASVRVVEGWRTGRISRTSPRYGYSDGRPLREPVIQEIRGADGSLAGVITRNAYGCLILNTDRALFVDVDIPELEDAPEKPGFFVKLLGSKTAGELIEPHSARVKQWVAAHPDWTWRVYQTRAGLRLLASNALFDPEGEEARRAFEHFGADPLYRVLCKNQKSFRARLTPKPWRCDLDRPPYRWPWVDQEQEKQFKDWEEYYLATAAEYATCKLLEVHGKTPPHPGLQEIISLHDKVTRSETESELGLA